MGGINLGRVFLGGLLAGLILNVSAITFQLILREEIAPVFQRFRLPAYAAALHLATNFALGIVLVWLYAAMRPRFGAGPKTAVYVGLTAWLFWVAFFVVAVGPLGIFPARILWINAIWGLFLAVICSLAGARLYKEE